MWFELTTLVVRGTDCMDSCKSNYHTITTTTGPNYNFIDYYYKHSLCSVDCDHVVILCYSFPLGPYLFVRLCITVAVVIVTFLPRSVLWFSGFHEKYWNLKRLRTQSDNNSSYDHYYMVTVNWTQTMLEIVIEICVDWKSIWQPKQNLD
jgi:hypothetical protein